MKQLALGALALAILAGCGGGGSDAPATPTTTTFPVESVLANVAATAGNYGGTFIDASGTSTLSISIAPGVQAAFTTGAPLSKTFTTSTALKKNGATVSTSSSTVFYSTGPLSYVGEHVGADIINITQHSAVPATATVGSSGPFFTGTDFLGGSVVLTSGVTGTWSLEADTASTAFVCLNTRIAGILVTSESDCFKVNAAGAIVGFKATVTTNARSTNANPVTDTFVFQ